MATATVEEKSGKVVIRNIGLLLSGDIDQPVLQADTVVVHDGLITAVGREKERTRRPTDADPLRRRVRPSRRG